MILSVDFYAQVSQIIPVLLLTGLIEMAAVSRRWSDHTLSVGSVFTVLIAMVMIVFGEVAALWAVSNEAENGLVRLCALWGLGAAGTFAMLPLVNAVLEWSGEARKRSEWLEGLGAGVIMLPWIVATIAAVVASAQND
ncbi:hypothetical protein [Knoellia sp. Soil729]|uniref:hypothetical protein n=1 Tax=Knoellia sp. Soil729 TaxID=1736394 RepID=UPI0006F43F83|nr:hypothetical protein [Knoellia sp. Soil729]KRE42274.1 hypothetical protein ASG74_07470 [Knoellia sp. Soil729]